MHTITPKKVTNYIKFNYYNYYFRVINELIIWATLLKWIKLFQSNKILIIIKWRGNSYFELVELRKALCVLKGLNRYYSEVNVHISWYDAISHWYNIHSRRHNWPLQWYDLISFNTSVQYLYTISGSPYLNSYISLLL